MSMTSNTATIVKRGSAGLGLFAARPFVRSDFIIEYLGEVISDEEANRRGGKYLFTLNRRMVIDGKDRGNLARYINHSCRPNCYAEINEDETRIFFYAKKKIAAGEELTYNYGKDYFERIIKPVGCKCEYCQTTNVGR